MLKNLSQLGFVWCFSHEQSGVLFLMSRVGLWIRGRRITGVNLFHPIVSRIHAMHMTSLLTLRLSDFSTVNLLFFFPFLYSSLEGSHYVQPIQRGGVLCSTSLRGWYLHKLFRILLQEDLSVSLSFYLSIFNHLFLSIWTHGYWASIYVILWVLSQCRFIYFVVPVIPALGVLSVTSNVPLA